MKRLLTSLMMLLVAAIANANDGVYYVNGNHLVPVQESDIAVTKEILTIDIGDDGYARVDVYYELTNRAKTAKTIDMGFEAQVPYNTGDNYDPTGRHPYIQNFSATMNGVKMTYKTGVVKASTDIPSNMRPINVKQYRVASQDEWEMGSPTLVDAKGNEIDIAYAYFFRATFKPGVNTVHHTYRYMASWGIYRSFSVPYWLTPATRWANHRIDDFTLRIKATNTAKQFYLPAPLFAAAQFKVTAGKGKVRQREVTSVGKIIEVSLRNGTVEWHARNFSPKENMFINSADALQMDDSSRDIGSFYDRGRYMPQYAVDFRKFYGRAAKNEAEEKELMSRILRNLPYADRGYVFTDQQLQRYFNAQWWYMPDASWEKSTADFTKQDWEVLNKLSKNIP